MSIRKACPRNASVRADLTCLVTRRRRRYRAVRRRRDRFHRPAIIELRDQHRRSTRRRRRRTIRTTTRRRRECHEHAPPNAHRRCQARRSFDLRPTKRTRLITPTNMPPTPRAHVDHASQRTRPRRLTPTREGFAHQITRVRIRISDSPQIESSDPNFGFREAAAGCGRRRCSLFSRSRSRRRRPSSLGRRPRRLRDVCGRPCRGAPR